MFARLAEASTSLDIGTLFVTAGCVTALLGLFLLFAWVQERMAALAWWGSAYLIGGFSAALWRSENVLPVPVPAGVADVLLFIALGMIWTAARAFMAVTFAGVQCAPARSFGPPPTCHMRCRIRPLCASCWVRSSSRFIPS